MLLLFVNLQGRCQDRSAWKYCACLSNYFASARHSFTK